MTYGFNNCGTHIDDFMKAVDPFRQWLRDKGFKHDERWANFGWVLPIGTNRWISVMDMSLRCSQHGAPRSITSRMNAKCHIIRQWPDGGYRGESVESLLLDMTIYEISTVTFPPYGEGQELPSPAKMDRYRNQAYRMAKGQFLPRLKELQAHIGHIITSDWN